MANKKRPAPHKNICRLSPVFARSLQQQAICLPVSDEEGLSPPLECRCLAFRHVVEVDLNLGQGQDVGGGAHADQDKKREFIRSVSSHLNRYKIEFNLSVPGIQGHNEDTLIESLEHSHPAPT